MFSPPRMMMSRERPVRWMQPSSCMTPRSPVCSQPSGSMASARGFGFGVVALHDARSRARRLRPARRRGAVAPVTVETILDFSLRHSASDGVDADFDGVVGVGHGDDRRAFCLTVGDDQLADVHFVRATRFISSMGQGAPDIMPVRRLVRSNAAKSGRASSATYMAGTP